ncbi:MAG: glycoside hydrolase family 9 protein [Fibrobacter sp.]|nr:glycoside hydrolase family 9 protein [Fibrobacter sp.]
MVKFIGVLFFGAISAHAATWIRYNQAGYTPGREKQAVVLSDTDISGDSWKIERDGKTVLTGTLGKGIPGDQIHFAQNFAYLIPFGSLKAPGVYVLSVPGAEPVRLTLAENPYALFASQALTHLREMRSGVKTSLHPTAHLGDSAAPVFVTDGNFSEGKWKSSRPLRKVDMRGGHYDAGDFIKFTLNEAYLAWHLLAAYEENPLFFTPSKNSLPPILEEAQTALIYLLKTFPDENTFIIQTGNGEDHEQGWRLPQNDPLDGKRPALAAISQVHMGFTAAALARGAKVFMPFNSALAAEFKEKAIAIYRRALKKDAIPYAYEMNNTNPFYRDLNEKDQMALAAAELFFLTHDSGYLEQAKLWAPGSASEVSWADQNFNANFRLALALAGAAGAKKRIIEEANRYGGYFPWNTPDYFTWASLHRWIGMANAKYLAERESGKNAPALFYGVLDYVFGNNNWGIAMIASENLPYGIQNIYNGIYRLTGAFPKGALSEGPGDRAMHNDMKKYFETALPPVNFFEPFNTEVSVFYDSRDDFMIQEATLTGQADLLFMLALASPKENIPPPKPGTFEPVPYREKQELAANRSRGAAALMIRKEEPLWLITAAPHLHVNFITIRDAHGNKAAKIFPDSKNRFFWNVKTIPPGIYEITPNGDKNQAVTVKR